MTINAKATMFFQNQDNQGWSESHYIVCSDIISAQSNLDLLVPLRLAVLPNLCEMLYARVSDTAIKGDSLLTTHTMPAAGTYSLGGTEHIVSADIGLLIQEFNNSQRKNHFFLRQLTSDIVHGTTYEAPSGFATALAAYFTQINTTWACRNIVSHGPPPVYTYNTIFSCRVVGVRSRKPGRPFGLPVGRRVRP